MLIIWMIIAFIVYHVFNVLIAIIQKSIVEHRIRNGIKKQIEHWLWAIIYMMLISPFYFLHNYWFISALVLLHFHVFGSAYQVINGNNAFYLSKTSSAITEKLMLWMGFKTAEKPYLASIVISIYLLIKSVT